MSVENKVVLFYGVNIGYDKYQEFEEELWDKDNILVDGMCGDYCFYGKNLAEIDEEDSDIIPINFKEDNIYKDIKFDVLNKFGINCEPKLTLIKHYY